jgi:pimeloyl-ACP methyl ester carboxylesterase
MQTTLQVGKSVVTLNYRLGKQVVVFSHGFGVRSDARGLFTDIVTALPKGWGYVLFDYDTFDDVTKRQQIVGFQKRLDILSAVLQWAETQNDVEKVHVVGHSIGALTIASLAPEKVSSLVLLAPPLSLGSRFVARFIKRPGAAHEADTWTIPRSDGTYTIIKDDSLAQLMNADAEGELSKLALFRPYTIILAGDDEVLPDEDYTALITMPSVNMFGIDKADHDFTGAARSDLVNTVLAQLSSPVSKLSKSD